MKDPSYRKIVNSWAMYDWANSAFATTIMAAMFPPFYREMAKSAGLSESGATAAWAYTVTIALCIVAMIGPVLGAVSDATGRKKKFIGFFAAMGVIASGLFVFLRRDSYLAGSILFIIANVGFAAGNVFYESLLPHIAREGDVDRVSARGYAFGYTGGGILLAINALWVLKPEWFWMPGMGVALRLSFFSVAVWWAAFSVPLFRNVPEPRCATGMAEKGNPLALGFSRLVDTLRHLRQYKQLALFLVAFWLYSDGINTVIKMATAYGDEIGIGITAMIPALILTQFVGIPATFAFGWLARIVGTKRMILVGLVAYAGISVGGFFLRTATHFFVLATLVGLVQGGTQALSRSLFASMVPREKSSEFFGFMSMSSRFAGIVGPLVFGAVSQFTGNSRISIASLVFFFVIGGVLLLFVRTPDQRGSGFADRGSH